LKDVLGNKGAQRVGSSWKSSEKNENSETIIKENTYIK
jgi:hypothetical protein